MNPTPKSFLIFFSLALSFAYSVLWAVAIWRSLGSEPRWTVELDFNHVHEGKLELAMFTVLPFVTLAAVGYFMGWW